jgi:endothelin-converting enzyme
MSSCRDILYGDPYATYNPVSVSKFTEVLPQFHFSTYLSTFAPRNFPKLIIVTDDAYAKFLSKILIETPADIVEAYLVSRTALSLSPYLGQSTEPWKAVRSLEEELHGMKKGAVGDRAEFCTSTVEMAMGFAAGRYFVNETFAGDSKEKGTKVITDIVKTFKHSLPDIEWMDEESASAAAQKVFGPRCLRFMLLDDAAGRCHPCQGRIPDFPEHKGCRIYRSVLLARSHR